MKKILLMAILLTIYIQAKGITAEKCIDSTSLAIKLFEDKKITKEQLHNNFLKPLCDMDCGKACTQLGGVVPPEVETVVSSEISKMLKRGQSKNATVEDLRNLGEIYYFGYLEIKEDKSKAFQYYKKAADKGDIVSQYNVGYSYRHGEGVKKDNMLAAKYYKLAADSGDAGAQNGLGYLYLRGEGVEQDKAKAYKYWMKAAKQGNKGSQKNLDVLCKNSPGVCK